MRFVLASASPARLATLRHAGLAPEVIVSGVDEDALTAAAGPRSTAELTGLLAQAKAHDVASRIHGDAVVVACDSLLDVRGRGYGKPGDAATVRARWAALRDARAVLHTGHCVVRIKQSTVVHTARGIGSATVQFTSPTDAELEAYISSGEPQQVAGGFTLDGLGGWFVAGVDGDPHTVVGISLPLLRRLLADVGVTLTDLGWPTPPPPTG